MNVLSVGLIIGVVALFLTGINRSAVSIGSKNWPTVSGIITTSTYREIDQDIQIHYRYTVAGKEYEQTRVYQGFSRPFGDHEPGISPRYKTRCLNKSNFARPYICLLINFRRFTWPSVWPLLHINEQPFRTAARSFFTLTAKW